MLEAKIKSIDADDDAALVRATIAGDRDAFSRIVARYQSLICSLAYSATGNLSQSEDLAQEIFVAAWKSLSRLPEPENLRAWLCGIARNLINNTLRRQRRDPGHAADGIGAIEEKQSPEPLPVENTISKEEQAILWRSLEQIPEAYREPLILYYREDESVELVAEKLALTPEAVHQRLSRGRKLLAEEVTAFVERALAKTSPGKNFTVAVLAAVPLMTATAKAATTAAVMAKGGAAAKGALTIGATGGFMAMIGGAVVSTKAQIDDSKSERERRFMLQYFGLRFCLALPVIVAIIGLGRLDYFHSLWHFNYFIAAVGLWISIQSAIVLPRYARRRRQIQAEDGTLEAAEWLEPRKTTDANQPGNRWKTLKFMALGIGATVYVLIEQPWKTDTFQALLCGLFMLLCVVRGYQNWRNKPRFQDFRRVIFYIPILCWMTTLAFFDIRQYLGRLTGASTGIVSISDIVFFTLAVSCAYIVLLAILTVSSRMRR